MTIRKQTRAVMPLLESFEDRLLLSGSATKLLPYHGSPSTVYIGREFTQAFEAVDDLGNIDADFTGSITVSVSKNPGGATLGGTLTVAAVDGIATFTDLTLDKPGSEYELEANSPGLAHTFTQYFPVVYPDDYTTAIQLATYNGSPSTVYIGQEFAQSFAALDPFGRIDVNYNGPITVSVSKNPGGATLGGTLTVAAVDGIATFTDLTLDKPGSEYELEANSPGLAHTFTKYFPVGYPADYGIATHLAPYNGSPSTVYIGKPFAQAFAALDPYGNIDDTYTGSITVSVSKNPGGATLGGTLTVAAVDGIATFTDLTLDKPGSEYELEANSPGLEHTFTKYFPVVYPDDYNTAVKLAPYNGSPSTVYIGHEFAQAFAALDPFGHIDVNYDGPITVSVSKNPGGATLRGTLTVAAVDGIATFTDLTLDKPGSEYELEANSPGLEHTFTKYFPVVYPDDYTNAIKLAPYNGSPSTVYAGNKFGQAFEALDPFGHVDVNYNGLITVSLAKNPGGSTLVGTLSVVAVNGIATFTNLTLDKPGSEYQLEANGSGLEHTFTAYFPVVYAQATKLVVTTSPPSTIVAGAGFGLAVTAEDDAGHVATNYTGKVTLAADDSSNPLFGTTTLSANTGLAFFFGLSLRIVGTTSILATAKNLASADTSTVQITAGKATKLEVATAPPSSTRATDGFGLTVVAKDAYGNTDTSFNGMVAVALASNPVGATLGGVVTTTAASGLATLSGLTLNKASAGYTLLASSTGLASGTSAPFTVIPSVGPDTIVISGNSVAAITLHELDGELPGAQTAFVVKSLPDAGTLLKEDGSPVAVDDSFNGPTAVLKYVMPVAVVGDFLTSFTFAAVDNGLTSDPATISLKTGSVPAGTLRISGKLGSEKIALSRVAETNALHTEIDGVSAGPDILLTTITSVVVFGDGGEDTFELGAGLGVPVAVHGEDGNETLTAGATSFTFDGGGGADSATVTTSSDADIVSLSPGGGSDTGVGYLIGLLNVPNIVIIGDGKDTADLIDSAGADTFEGGKLTSVLRGASFSSRVSGFKSVTAHATAGGTDTAKLSDSSGVDNFVARPAKSTLSGKDFSNVAIGFEIVQASSTAGGADIATMYDSSGSDTFIARPKTATLSGKAFSNTASGFATVVANSTAGGTDKATFFDSSGADAFAGSPTVATLSGKGFSAKASGFKTVVANSTAGGADVAQLHDSRGNDKLTSHPQDSVLSGAGYSLEVKGFKRVNAYATSGGNDSAILYGLKGGGTFYGTPKYSYFRGSNFYNYASGFDSVSAKASAGSDQALLFDTGTTGFYKGSGKSGQLSGPGYSLSVVDFGTVQIDGRKGTKNTIHVGALSYALKKLGTWTPT